MINPFNETIKKRYTRSSVVNTSNSNIEESIGEIKNYLKIAKTDLLVASFFHFIETS